MHKLVLEKDALRGQLETKLSSTIGSVIIFLMLLRFLRSLLCCLPTSTNRDCRSRNSSEAVNDSCSHLWGRQSYMKITEEKERGSEESQERDREREGERGTERCMQRIARGLENHNRRKII